MKRTSKAVLGLVVLSAGLSGCGLRGPLERPDPIFRDVPAIEETIEKETENEAAEPQGPALNEFGGEIPETAPIDPVVESSIDDAETEL